MAGVGGDVRTIGTATSALAKFVIKQKGTRRFEVASSAEWRRTIEPVRSRRYGGVVVQKKPTQLTAVHGECAVARQMLRRVATI